MNNEQLIMEYLVTRSRVIRGVEKSSAVLHAAYMLGGQANEKTLRD